MTEFYYVSSQWRMIIQILLIFGIVSEMVTLIMIFFLRAEKQRWFRVLFEAGIIYFFFVINLSIGLIQINAPNNLVVEPYPIMRAMSVIVPILGMPILMLQHQQMDLVAIFSLILALPFMDAFMPGKQVYLISFIVLLLFSRAAIQLVLAYRDVRRDISRFSVKEAFDTFPEGLAIGKEHGGILLINQRMRSIMQEKGLTPGQRSSRLRISFRRMMRREALAKRDQDKESKTLFSWLLDEKQKDKKVQEKERALQTFSSAGKVYRYKEEAFELGNEDCRQILVNDITKEDQLIHEIKQKNAELQESNQQLMTLLSNIEEIETEKESSRMRNRIHDIMGQRLSILHGTLQQMDRKATPPPLEELIDLLEDMVYDLREPELFHAENRFRYIQNTAEIVGTKLIKEGEIPEDEKIANVLLQVLREAVTNAIRHGQADLIRSKFFEDEEKWYLEIVNNGAAPVNRLKEGEGIRGMRHKLESISGSLEIRSDEYFSLSIEVPKAKEKED